MKLPITEPQMQEAIIDCAHAYGWRVAHFRPAKTDRGWRTPVAADGKGFPDLVLVRGGRLIFAELKSATGKLSADQESWLNELRLACGETFVWTPNRWLDGTIERVLR